MSKGVTEDDYVETEESLGRLAWGALKEAHQGVQCREDILRVLPVAHLEIFEEGATHSAHGVLSNHLKGKNRKEDD